VTTPFQFEVTGRDPGSGARRGVLRTAHGEVQTPAFMPVGTYGTVKGMTPRDLTEIGAQILLCNALHLHDRPGEQTVGRLGGIQKFMGWDGPVLTDSGGYQVYSLADLSTVEEGGVRFRSPLDGRETYLTPELLAGVQAELGVDIAMAFDQCVRLPAGRKETEEAVERTRVWAERCRRHWGDRSSEGRGLFGIVQGGLEADLRQESAEQIAAIGFEGYAVGGLSVGEDKTQTWPALEAALGPLPDEAPHYLMGVGTPTDILESVRRGVDLFDCVIPTRHARNATLFSWNQGPLNLRGAMYAEDTGPVDPECGCTVCRTHSRGYIRHLLKRNEMLGAHLATYHNLAFYLEWMRRIRAAIHEGTLDRLEAPAI
jgi:queuine tRNA-ribosyltransferase